MPHTVGPRPPKLRKYQENTLDDLRRALRRHRSVLLQSPTGSGKSVMIAHMMRTSAERGMRSWLICHRRELIDQLSDHLWSVGVSHGIIAAGSRQTHDPIQVASVQTLVRRLDKLLPPDLLAIDEAHHATATTYRKIVEHCRGAWIVGLSATPQRTDGTGLGDIFDGMVHGPTVAELTKLGYLSPYRIIAPAKPIDMTGVRSRMGDYVTSELEAVVDQGELTGSAVEHYVKYVAPGTCLVYCVSRAHAHHVTDAYLEAGILAQYVAGDTTPEVRRLAIEGFKNGMPPVIVSVDLFGEGLDAPGLRAVQLLRPTKSLILHLQQVGRALRIEDGKDSAIILDHCGNSWLHGLPDDFREWSLEGRAKKDSELSAPSLRHCPECFSIYRAILGACPLCGWEPKVEPRILEETDEELVEIDQVEHRRLRKGEEGRARGLEALVALAVERKYRPGWAARKQSYRSKEPLDKLRAEENRIRREMR